MNRLFRLIPGNYRRKGVIVALMVPLTALLDMFGVAVLFSMVFLVLDGGAAFNGSFLPAVMCWLGIEDRNTFLVIFVLFLLLFILLKSIINILIRLYQNRYLMSLFRYFSSRLFADLFSKGLLFLRNSNTSELTFNVNSACYNFAVGYLGSVLKFWGEVVFCFFMLVTLSVYDIRSLLSIVIAFIPVTVIHIFIVKKRLREYGSEEFKARKRQTKVVQETFRGYAEMKVNDAFGTIYGRFDEGLKTISGYRVKSSLIQAIPSRMYELAIAVVLVVMVLLHLDAGDPSERLFLGVFAVAIVRMLPVVLSLVGNWGTVRNTEFTLTVIGDLEDIASRREEPYVRSQAPRMDFTDEIQVRNLSFSFPDRELFSDLSFNVKKGEKFGIKGRTGSGKSTIFNILLGLIPPDGGSVLIDGRPLEGETVRSWQDIVGYVSQDVFISDTTIAENIALGCSSGSIDMVRMNDAIDRACLRPFIDSLPDGVDTMIGEAGCRVSGGQRQRIGIARALYKGAQVLFFDEATSSLDVNTENQINEEIRELSKNSGRLTILIISHRPGSLEMCDRVMEL